MISNSPFYSIMIMEQFSDAVGCRGMAEAHCHARVKVPSPTCILTFSV